MSASPVARHTMLCYSGVMRLLRVLVLLSSCATVGSERKASAPYGPTTAQREVIAAAIRGQLTTLQQCARAHLVEGDPSSAISVTFGIDWQGHVVYPHAVDNSLPSSAMVECVLATFRDMTFPAEAGRGLLDFTSARILFGPYSASAAPRCDEPPALHAGDANADAVSSAELWAVLREHEQALQLCYGLDAINTKGVLTLRMDVDDHGVPRDVQVADGTLSSASAIACVVDTLKATRFTARAAAARKYTFPLRFTDERCSPAFVIQRPPLEPHKATTAERQEMKQQVSKNINAITSCYERSLRQELPGASSGVNGYVIVAFGIDRRGRVIHPNAPAHSLASEPVIACILKTFAEMRFKPRANNTAPAYLTYAFSFVLEGSVGAPLE